MRNLVVVFVMIIMSTSFAMGQEIFAVHPPKKLNIYMMLGSTNEKDKKLYNEFKNAIPEHYNKLDQLFKTNSGNMENLENEWQMVCQAMRTDIQKARIIIQNIGKGSDARSQGVEWFQTLMSIVVKLESEGLKTFQAKVKLEKLIMNKNKSLKDQEIHKKKSQQWLRYFDERITFTKGYKQSNNKAQWLKDFEAKNSGLNFENLLKESKSFAYNDSVALKEYKKNIADARKKDNPSHLAGKEKYLISWEIKNDNIQNLLAAWQRIYVKRHKEYNKLYNIWKLDNSWVFDDTLFRDTKYMRGWTWQNFYQKYLSEVSVDLSVPRRTDRLEQTHKKWD